MEHRTVFKNGNIALLTANSGKNKLIITRLPHLGKVFIIVRFCCCRFLIFSFFSDKLLMQMHMQITD